MYTTRNDEGSPSLSERYFRAKSLTNCDVHFAESLLQTHYRVCKNIMANKEVAYKAETGYTALIKRRIT